MFHSHRTRTVTPAQLTDAERDDLYATHCRIFDGVSRAAFESYVIDSPAAYTRIQLLEDGTGTIRGYTAFHIFEQGSRLVVRMEAGVERAWRRLSSSGVFIAAELSKFILGNPGKEKLFVASLVHPSAYVALHRQVPEMWPSLRAPTPPHIQACMAELAEQFKMQPASAPGTVKVGWITRDAGDAPRRISEEAAFFLAQNPNYGHGEGLLTVIPTSADRLVKGLWQYAGFRLRRALSGAWSAAQQRLLQPAATASLTNQGLK